MSDTTDTLGGPVWLPQLSINELTTYRWPFEEDISRYLEHNISSLSVWRHKLSDFGEEKAIDLIHDTGLHVAAVLWAGGFTGSEGRTYRETIADATDAIELASALNADCVLLHPGSRAGHTHNHARRLVTHALSELAPVAAEHGVFLGLEPMPECCAEQCTFLNSLEDALDLIRQLDLPQLKIVLDVYYWGHDRGLLDELEHLVPHLGLVQLGDGHGTPGVEQNRCLLGEGDVLLQEVIDRLIECGYGGYFDVEILGEDVERLDYASILRHTMDYCERAFAAHAPWLCQMSSHPKSETSRTADVGPAIFKTRE